MNKNLQTPTDLDSAAVKKISDTLRQILADVFALYLKTKNFHWHMSGVHFRDHHLLLDEQADQLFAMTDDLAERARKMGAGTLHSISDITKHQQIKDNNEEYVAPLDMIAELCADNQHLTKALRAAHGLCEENEDIATASMLEVWTDQSERRVWFLFEITRNGQSKSA